MSRFLLQWGAATIASLLATGSLADTVLARCDIYPRGEDKVSQVVPCYFSQRQGYVGITLKEGRDYRLAPTGSEPGNYLDAEGRPAYRQAGLGPAGLIFRLDDVSIYVYWDAAIGDEGGTADD